MRILQLTPRLPYPPTDGGRVVMLQIARSMQRLGNDVHILSLNPRKQRGDVDEVRRALAPVMVDAVDVDTSAHVAAIVRAYRIGAPQIVARFFTARFARALHECASQFDVIQIESPFLLPYVPMIREASNATVVLRSLNVEFRIWERLAENQTNVLRRSALRAIARSLRRYEIAQLDTCDALVPITEDDARDFRTLGCTRPIHVLPGGVELDDHAVDRTGERANSVGFLGSLDYRPNQEAALWIAEEMWPRLEALEPGAELHIGGSHAPAWLRARLARAGVTLADNVPDAAAFIRPMHVMIAPILSGGGMRIKILEAMALGKPVVATTIGAQGIDVRHSENILLADDADSFAAAVSQLLRDASRARAIGDAGRRLVEMRYGSDALARDLLAFYTELTQGLGVRVGR